MICEAIDQARPCDYFEFGQQTYKHLALALEGRAQPDKAQQYEDAAYKASVFCGAYQSRQSRGQGQQLQSPINSSCYEMSCCK